MARSDLALGAVRRAYDSAHAWAAVRGVALAGVFGLLAIGLHRTTHATWIVGALLALALAGFGWRGGAARRGALAGALAGLPVFLAPTIVFAILHGGMQCPNCALGPSLPCLAACLGTSLLAGILIGFSARRESSRFFAGAIVTALLVGLLGCSTTGLGGAIGITLGVIAGGVTGWLVQGRAAHA
jgi:hypothetical protein